MKLAHSIEHPCLAASSGEPLGAAEVTDRIRLSLTLQAAGLLAHLRAAGWKLVGDLEQGLCAHGQLVGLGARPGHDEAPMHRRLRALLLALFRCQAEIPGRGEARRSARQLVSAWSQPLAPLSADEVLRQILHQAGFLWRPDFWPARRALFAVVDGERVPRSVGPARFQLRIERRLSAGSEVDDLIRDPDFRADWEGAGQADPVRLVQAGRWLDAVSTFRVRGARGEGERVPFAEALLAMGKFEQALEVLERLHGDRPSLIRLHSLTRLQRLGAARRLLTRMEKQRLDAHQVVETAEVALRVFSNLGDQSHVGAWEERLRRVRDEDATSLAKATLAGAAYDQGDIQGAAKLLEQCKDLREDPREGWRWFYAEGLRALGDGDGLAAEAALRRALLDYRRRLTRVHASLLWTNMVSAAELCGDLQAAERAASTAYRLGMGFEGPLPTSVLLYNFVEVLLKRGKVDGVRELLDEVGRTDRLAGNRRALAHDVELKARYHLTRGRADRALRAVDELLAEADGVGWRLEVLQAWAARALGLLGRPEEALERLEMGGESGLRCFDREEIPAVWALAGNPERARAEAKGPIAELWVGALSDGAKPRSHWDMLDLLDPYQAARLVRDLELVRPGVVPRRHRLRAIRILRSLGLELPAQALERQTGGAWTALGRYLDPETGGDIETLFADAGYGDLRLEWDGPGAEVLFDGGGGQERYTQQVGAGQLVVDADVVDQPLRTLVSIVSQRMENRTAHRSGPAPAPGGIIGDSPALQAALNDAGRLAGSQIPMLILGETGTGKELVARWVHAESPRSKGPFVAVNCAAISESLRNSELFGHAKGAFTGAERGRAGYFETADRGTIFLDEIGDLSLEAQGGLLRVLQESELMRVGESRPRKIDIRVVAATHRNLQKMMADGTFRHDLFYRLNQSLVDLPPLRDRGEDVVQLAKHFCDGVDGDEPAVTLDQEAIAALRRYRWPGNVRELRSVLEAAKVFCEDHRITVDDLRLPEGPRPPRGDLQSETLEFRRRRILEELDRGAGNQAEAARALGLTRQGLSYWVKKLGIMI